MTRCKHVLSVLAALALALVFASGVAAQVSDHHDLGEDSIFDVPRDIFGDIQPFVDAPDAVAPASQRGCTTKFLSTNFSSRNGATARELVAHYTVSRNVAGLADVNAIWSFFNRASTDASSNYIIDFEGNCIYAVPEDAKAWTQGAFNPTSISIEFIAMGTERVWPEAALRKGAMVFADAARRHGIPIRLVDPVGCDVPAGVTDHNRLECGNTHTDVAPHFPMAKFISYIQEAASPPKTFVHFILGSGEGRGIAKSMAVETGPNELARLREFLAFRAPAALKEARADGDFTVRRKKGRP